MKQVFQLKVAKRKQDLALEMVKHARELELEYKWVGCDGFYGEDPAFLRALDTLPVPEIFMADVHKDQRVYLEDPKPIVPPPSRENVVKNLLA